MEVKVQCACGTRYKFEVEPIHGRMPGPVTCPSCGADGTAQANEFLRSALQEPPQPVPASLPLPAPESENRPRVRIAAASEDGPPVPPPMRAPPLIRPPPPAPASARPWVGALSALLILACVGFGAWMFGKKWYHRMRVAGDVASVLGPDTSGSEDKPAPQNFWYEDCVVLFVQHTNRMEVAKACVEYWRERLHKNLEIIPNAEPAGAEREYVVLDAHNGYVRIIGGLEWPQAQYEGLALHLSQRFDTRVFETRDVDFSGAYHFGVYEQGARKFHAQMDVRIVNNNVEEKVVTEGNDWALAHGYQPGAGGFQEFSLADGDRITQRLGMKLWDEPEGTELKGLLLRE